LAGHERGRHFASLVVALDAPSLDIVKPTVRSGSDRRRREAEEVDTVLVSLRETRRTVAAKRRARRSSVLRRSRVPPEDTPVSPSMLRSVSSPMAWSALLVIEHGPQNS
jgi:hypothetical protein